MKKQPLKAQDKLVVKIVRYYYEQLPELVFSFSLGDTAKPQTPLLNGRAEGEGEGEGGRGRGNITINNFLSLYFLFL